MQPSNLLKRLQGWEGRMAAVLDAARVAIYALGQQDCFRLACASLEALTGVDRWPEFAGRYRTTREALKVILEHGATYTEAMTWFFGCEPEAMAWARRGDIAEFVDESGVSYLGIVVGSHVAMLGDQGLVQVKRSACRHFWRIA